jgi:hypothetical protein
MGENPYPKDSFAAGYFDGWKAIPGSGPPPAISSYTTPQAVPAGKTPYQAGYEQGRAIAGGK